MKKLYMEYLTDVLWKSLHEDSVFKFIATIKFKKNSNPIKEKIQLSNSI